MAAIAGLDVGGTTTRVAVVIDGRRTVRTFPTSVDRPDALTPHVLGVLTDTARSAGIPTTDLSGVGVALPGIIDQGAGTVRFATNLGIGENPLPLARLVADDLGLPTRIDNDVKAAALGLAGELPNPDRGILSYISIGTGIASATVIDGTVLRGVHGSAGEIGQIQIRADGPPLEGALPGSLESLASGRSLDLDRRSNGRVDGLGAVIDHLAVGIHALWMTVDPDLLILGGGVTHNPGFTDRITAALETMRSASPVTRSVVDLERLRVLPVDALPGIDGALHLATHARESGGVTHPAHTGGNT